ncbi:putative rhamnogalacturonate lyase C [Colletotrichum shisoi]|uniref:Putative rhamnogalacturonate lyase C n=1 Tax=Colletotrichum shisoi TaxID=2078593 RepID=A0A5Q4BRP5_9PEZI|nr:putative rhamnogalacturonate lyase C [Colletotrichum shisoi]
MAFFRTSSGLDVILDRSDGTLWERLRMNPLTTMARYLNDFFPVSFPVAGHDSDGDSVTVVCISDTHNFQPRLPPGDILVHAGDLTASGTRGELRRALDWLKAQPHRHKIVVAGNHDLCLDESLSSSGIGGRSPVAGRSRDEKADESAGGQDDDDDDEGNPLDWGDITYLNRTSTTLRLPGRPRGIRVYGSPYTPRYGAWAFQYPRSPDEDPWAGAVPASTDVLVTHGPPKGHMDDPRGGWGCELLLRELWRARPRLHVFGHVHCGHGRETVAFDPLQAAYEDVVLREAVARASGDPTAWARGWAALGQCLAAWVHVWWGGGRRRPGETVLVNAAVVGGIRDRLVREAIVVKI